MPQARLKQRTEALRIGDVADGLRIAEHQHAAKAARLRYRRRAVATQPELVGAKLEAAVGVRRERYLLAHRRRVLVGHLWRRAVRGGARVPPGGIGPGLPRGTLERRQHSRVAERKH